MIQIFSLLLIIFLLSSCGESKNSEEFKRPDEEVAEPEVLQAIYRADLRAVNPEVTNAEGQVTIRLVEDDFEVTIALRGVTGSIHPQRILTGKECPGVSADSDADGLISFTEAEAVSGGSLIPLDGNLRLLSEDINSFPRGTLLRAYAYNEEASRTELRSQLGQDFFLEERVVMIYGNGDDLSVPIACGELIQISGIE